MFKSPYIQWEAIVSFLALFLYTSLAAAAPQITGFDVDQVTTLRPGTAVDFTLSGTPKARVTIRISGIPRLIVLKETGPGFYEGRYIVRQKDRISSRSAVVATLSKGKSHTIARLGQSILASAAPVPSDPPDSPEPTPIAISKFSVDSYDNLEPGTELDFTLVGTPAGRATYTIENVIANRRMREVRPGVYTGQYTIRRQDKLPAALNVVGTLQANGQSVRAQLPQPINNPSSNNPPSSANPFSHFSPRQNESIPYSNNFTVSGDFEDDPRKGGVDPKSIQILFNGRDVTSQSTITGHNFSYRPTNLTPGRHTVEVRGRDSSGNIVRSNWEFKMLDAAPVAAFPLDITSPRDGAEVGGSGAIEVRGRTLPNASVQVGVTAGILGLSQRIFENTLVADRQGYFSFSFQPQLRVPGARYEVTVRATRDNEMRERKMTLIQQR